MKAAKISEMLANLYRATCRDNPEDSHFHIHRRENMKFYDRFQFDITRPDMTWVWRKPRINELIVFYCLSQIPNFMEISLVVFEMKDTDTMIPLCFHFLRLVKIINKSFEL
jgi:abortive infection bacteriophage resistance protein